MELMIKMKHLAWLLLHVLCLSEAATNRSSVATYKLVYEDIQAFVGCYRRFNGTHEIGCTTGMNGNVGIIHYINSTESLDWLVDKGPHQPYIPVIDSEFFTAPNVRKMEASGKINGIMVFFTDASNTDSYPSEGFSPDLQCPNEQSSIYIDDNQYSCKKHQFNSKGSGLMFDDLKIPVMLLKSEVDVDKIISCYNEHNLPSGKDGEQTFPLCSAELKAFMHGAGNTEICWRRNSIVRNFSPDSYCQKLGGFSSIAFLDEERSSAPRKKTIVVTARSDALSLFEYNQPGTSSPAAGIATLLAVAEAMKPVRDVILNAGYNVLFLALTGESFDYIGSQKLVYDMERDHFPNKTTESARMRLDNVNMLVELSQFINGAASKQIFAHVDPKTKSNHNDIQKFIDLLKSEALSITVSEARAGQPLPPSSAQMFIREKESGMPAIVLADYDSQYKTKYYNGYLDTPEVQGVYANRSSIDYDEVTDTAAFLADVATTISRAIYKYATNNTSSPSLVASNSTTNHLLYCLLIGPQCELFYTVVSPKNIEVVSKTSTPFPFYVSVYQYTTDYQHIQYMMLQLLAYFTGDVVDVSEATCKGDIEYPPYTTFWINGPMVNGSRENVCIRTTAQYHNASSPAFDIEDYDFTSSRYSTWTESVWPNSDAFGIRIFLKPSTEVELASMVAGISIFIISAIVSVLIQRRSAVLFPPHTAHHVLETDGNRPA